MHARWTAPLAVAVLATLWLLTLSTAAPTPGSTPGSAPGSAPGSTSATTSGYQIDPDHTSIYFRIGHMGISQVYGRFNQPHGTFSLGDNPAFSLTIQTAHIDTGVKKRDDHLRSPDFFNASEYPRITFQSTGVAPADDGYLVTGDLTLHGVTRSIAIPLQKIGEIENAQGRRAGFATEITLNRSDYGMTQMIGPVGDEVTLLISFEGASQ